MDVFTRTEPTYEPVVDAAEQLLFLVRDADDRELRETVEVVDDAGILQLVDLVEDDDGSQAVVLLKAVDEFVVGCRLSVDVDGGAEIVEDLFPEPFVTELRGAGLAGCRGVGDDGRVSGFTVRDGLKNAGEVVDFGVAILGFPRDEPGVEDASIADYLYLND